MHNEYSFTSKVWLYEGFGGWHFVHVPKDMSQEIKERFGSVKKRGFGSIPVTVTIGSSTWKTSIFPSKEGGYLLALKSAIRHKEHITESSVVSVTIEIRAV